MPRNSTCFLLFILLYPFLTMRHCYYLSPCGNDNLLVNNNTIYTNKHEAPSGDGVYFKSGNYQNVRF